MKRIGLLVIGDEILAGHVHESNGHWLAKRCKELGLELARLEICTDQLDDIETSVRRFLHDLNLDYVVTSGGLGPTHDDRTMEGLAAAINQPLVMETEWEEWMEQRVAFGHKMGYFRAAKPNAGMLKMAHLPLGSTAMPNHRGTALGAMVTAGNTTLFTLPGVPSEFELMFDESVLPHLQTSAPAHVEELVLYTEESRFFEVMRDLETNHPGVAIGSYPQRGHILVRATGPKQAALAAIADMKRAGSEYLEPRA